MEFIGGTYEMHRVNREVNMGKLGETEGRTWVGRGHIMPCFSDYRMWSTNAHAYGSCPSLWLQSSTVLRQQGCHASTQEGACSRVHGQVPQGVQTGCTGVSRRMGREACLFIVANSWIPEPQAAGQAVQTDPKAPWRPSGTPSHQHKCGNAPQHAALLDGSDLLWASGSS